MKTLTKKVYGPGDDLEFLKDVNLWPQWPFCPVKNRKWEKEKRGWQKMGCGVIHAGWLEPIRVWEANLFDLPETIEEFKKLPFVEYASIEECLADGWEVD